MRAAIVGLALILLVAPFASAQEGPRPSYRKGSTPDQVALIVLKAAYRDITLSADQQSKALDIIKTARATAATLNRSAPDFQQRNMRLLDERNAKLRALLVTDADKSQFDKNVKNDPPAPGW